MNLKIGLIGKGFVGEALYESFTKRGQTVKVYDKYKKIGSIEDVLDTSLIFLCLPTPFIDGYGYDLSSIREVCRQLSELKYDRSIILKSTVEPGTTLSLSQEFKLRLVHNPEFLTQRTSLQDFDGQKHIVIGVTDKKENAFFHQGIYTAISGSSLLVPFYKSLYPNAEISVCLSGESEAMKIFCNNFYAMKVQIFNEFYLLCQRLNLDYNTIKDLMLKNGWIAPHHMTVPGPDGKLSYGGACFSKDTNALNELMKRNGTLHEVLDATIRERNKMRKD